MLGFTKQEQKIVLFLIFSLLLGAGAKVYKRFIVNEKAAGVDQELIDEFKYRAAQIRLGVYDSLESNSSKEAASNEQKAGIAESKPYVNRETGNQDINPDIQSRLRVDINSASSSELQQLPRIGPVLAQKIIDYRIQNGKFNRVEELLQVKGIGKATLKRIESHIVLK